jgi:hypothetical protein
LLRVPARFISVPNLDKIRVSRPAEFARCFEGKTFFSPNELRVFQKIYEKLQGDIVDLRVFARRKRRLHGWVVLRGNWAWNGQFYYSHSNSSRAFYFNVVSPSLSIVGADGMATG